MFDVFRVVASPDPATATLAFALGGVLLGTASGLVPGLHANNFALLLASVAPALPGEPTQVGAAILAAGIVHTFLDIVPALALGVPDPAMATGALPGHRLVLAGRGREALRLSALGSGLGLVLALPLAFPVTAAMTVAYPVVRAHLAVVLLAVVAFLVLTEPTVRAALGGLAAFALSAILGYVALPLSPSSILAAGGILTPLFAGLFGAPVLLDALDGAGVPGQGDATLALSPGEIGITATAGTVGGALVGYLPGVSAAVAAVLALPMIPGRCGARGFVVTTSGANTATAVFALFALLSLGTPRTGVMVAMSTAKVPLSLPTLLPVAVFAAAVAFVLVPVIGDRYLAWVGAVNNALLCVGVLLLLVLISFLFAGVVGIVALIAATGIGTVPSRVGTRRVHLMGVLIGPLALG